MRLTRDFRVDERSVFDARGESCHEIPATEETLFRTQKGQVGLFYFLFFPPPPLPAWERTQSPGPGREPNKLNQECNNIEISKRKELHEHEIPT
jgi:hypothetical protein